MQAYFLATQFGECISTRHQDAAVVGKKLDKVKADLQATLDDNSTLKVELRVAYTIKELKVVEKKELSKKLLASKDAYQELVEKYSPLLVKKEKLKKGIGELQSSIEELITEINPQLCLGFEIMRDAIKEIMLDFDFKRLDEIVSVEATRCAQFTTPKEGEEGLEDLVMPTAISSVPVVVEQTTQVMEGSAQGIPIIIHLARDVVALPQEHIEANAGNDDGSKGDIDQASTHPNLPLSKLAANSLIV